MARTKKTDSIIKPCNDDTKFPYETFLYRLETKEGKTKRICWFTLEEDLYKHIERHKLNTNDYLAEHYKLAK